MSYAFHPFYDLLLESDVKENIMIKIKYIQAYNDWRDFDLNINNNTIGKSEISLDDIEKQCNVWKHLAKLSIDLWSDYDYYRQFRFENQFDDDEYKERLENLGFEYKNDLWKSVTKPSENTVQINVFIYCLYSLIALKMKQNKTENVVDQSIICGFCSSDIRPSSDSCSICRASVEEINGHRSTLQENESTQAESLETNICSTVFGSLDSGVGSKDGIVDELESREGTICGLEVYESFVSGLEDNERNRDGLECNERIIFEVEDDAKQSNKVSSEGKEGSYCGLSAIKRADKWKCGGCGFLNDYTFVNCVTCEALYKDGRWMCSGCGMENLCVNDRCEGCGSGNMMVKEATEEVAEVVRGGGVSEVPRKLRWQCGHCVVWQSYEADTCGQCRGSRALVGRWPCLQCTLINQCSATCCAVCGTPNTYLTAVLFCEHCHRNRVRARSSYCRPCLRRRMRDRWQCSFKHCGHWNVTNEASYCGQCGLGRDHSHIRGDLVKQQRPLGTGAISGAVVVVTKWICYQCSTFNEPSHSLCVSCARTRYKKRYCALCDDLNDGLSINCDKCYRMLP